MVLGVEQEQLADNGVRDEIVDAAPQEDDALPKQESHGVGLGAPHGGGGVLRGRRQDGGGGGGGGRRAGFQGGSEVGLEGGEGRRRGVGSEGERRWSGDMEGGFEGEEVR